MSTTWALVADRSEARILERRGPSHPFHVVEVVHHPEGRLQAGEIDADTGGKPRDGASSAKFQPQERADEHAATVFAKHLAEHLRHARTVGRFERLVIAAEPTFLGRLRNALDPATKKLVAGEIHKHLLGAGDGELQPRLVEAAGHVA
jgi:protein required for attachment to host cells